MVCRGFGAACQGYDFPVGPGQTLEFVVDIMNISKLPINVADVVLALDAAGTQLTLPSAVGILAAPVREPCAHTDSARERRLHQVLGDCQQGRVAVLAPRLDGSAGVQGRCHPNCVSQAQGRCAGTLTLPLARLPWVPASLL